jgi:hypothetical protein
MNSTIEVSAGLGATFESQLSALPSMDLRQYDILEQPIEADLSTASTKGSRFRRILMIAGVSGVSAAAPAVGQELQPPSQPGVFNTPSWITDQDIRSCNEAEFRATHHVTGDYEKGSKRRYKIQARYDKPLICDYNPETGTGMPTGLTYISLSQEVKKPGSKTYKPNGERVALEGEIQDPLRQVIKVARGCRTLLNPTGLPRRTRGRPVIFTQRVTRLGVEERRTVGSSERIC